MAEELTGQQKKAVFDRGGRLLVSAAAGSGKTKVLVDRLMSYLTAPGDPANIDDFLLITYTKAAAAELRGKIAAKLTERVAQEPNNVHLQRQLQRLYLTKISTVHSFCGDILREYAYRLDLSADFRVADENECVEIRTRVLEKLLTQAYEENLEDADFRAFVDSQGLGRDDRLVPQIIQQVYDSARCHLNPEQWLQHCRAQVDAQIETDAGQTDYGRFLIAEFHEWLALQIEAMEECARLADQTEGLQKPAALLRDTVYQLRQLAEAQTWEEIRQKKDISFGTLTFPKSLSDKSIEERIKAVRNSLKDELKKKTRIFAESSERLLADLNDCAGAVRGLMKLVGQFGTAYDSAKKSRRIVDFGDLEHKMLDLLLGRSRSGQTAVAREIGSRFREVMVDEYQDSNEVQDAIYNALTAEKKNLFMVGDVKQSIYRFRLADPGIFLKKYNTFLPANQAQTGQDRKVVLSKNFRSSGSVLEGCNDVFRLCMSPRTGGMYYGEEEALYEGKPDVDWGEAEVALHCIEAQHSEEAAYVARQIAELLKNGKVRDGNIRRPIKPEDIAILLRSPNSSGSDFQKALDGYGVRYATGGGVDLFKTEEVGTLYAILQVVYNPRLDIPLVAALLSPAFGFTADDLAAIRAPHTACSFYDALRRDGGEKSRRFMEIFVKLRSLSGRQSLTELLDQILIATAFEEIYGAMEGGEVRLSNIRTFYQLAAEQEAAGNRDLGHFLEHLQSLEEKGLISEGDQSAAGCVTIMSIHKSKGLEFPVVFLCGLSRKFNMEDTKASVLCHKDMGLGLLAVDEKNRLRYPTLAKLAIAAQIRQESLSEELRVLYVAMTRAKDRLIMTYADKNLVKDLREMVQRMDMGGMQLLIREATCPGIWVLLTALRKTEAGALFAVAGKPEQTATGEHPWKILLAYAEENRTASAEKAERKRGISESQMQQIRNGLSFTYPYSAAVMAPSKLTATALKGRYKDQEAAEQTHLAQSGEKQWRQPSFASPDKQGKDYGNAVHGLMQYIDYEACGNLAGVHGEIRRLCEQGYLTAQQAQLIKAEQIAAFFATELGQKLRKGKVIREFKFSVLQDGTHYDPRLSGEAVLLQGVVDCALMEEDGMTVLDFKTDRINAENLEERVKAYVSQVNAYAQALEDIFEQKVKEKLLYFFHLGKFVRI